MAKDRDAEVLRKLFSATHEADMARFVEVWAPDCTVLIAGNHPLSGEHKGREAIAQLFQQHLDETGGTFRPVPEPLQMFADGRGHVVAVRRWTADRNGRHMDALGGAVYTIRGGRIASVEQCEEDLDAVNEFWGGSAAAQPGLGTDWRADVDLIRRAFQGAVVEGNNSVYDELGTSDVKLHVQGNHTLSGEFPGLDGMRQWLERIRRESGGTVSWELEHTFADGHGHLIIVRHMTADRHGRHLDTRGAAHLTIRDGRFSDVEMYEEDLDTFQAFWAA